MYRMKGKGRDERAFVLDRAEREFERHLLFKHAFGIILRIDLDSGQYHIRYGAHAVSSRLPSAGPYEQVLSDDLLHPVLPEDKTMLQGKAGAGTAPRGLRARRGGPVPRITAFAGRPAKSCG